MGLLSFGYKGLKAIKSVKIAKDLTKRRKDFEDVIKSVGKKYKDAGVKITDEGKKIKYDAAKKISSIHDKYTKK